MVTTTVVMVHHLSVFVEEGGPSAVITAPVIHETLEIGVFVISTEAFVAGHLHVVSASSHLAVSALEFSVDWVASRHLHHSNIVTVVLSEAVEFSQPDGEGGPSPLGVIAEPCLSHLTLRFPSVVLLAVEFIVMRSVATTT